MIPPEPTSGTPLRTSNYAYGYPPGVSGSVREESSWNLTFLLHSTAAPRVLTTFSTSASKGRGPVTKQGVGCTALMLLE